MPSSVTHAHTSGFTARSAVKDGSSASGFSSSMDTRTVSAAAYTCPLSHRAYPAYTASSISSIAASALVRLSRNRSTR